MNAVILVPKSISVNKQFLKGIEFDGGKNDFYYELRKRIAALEKVSVDDIYRIEFISGIDFEHSIPEYFTINYMVRTDKLA